MSLKDYKILNLLTEHLETSPILLIDDIIIAANEAMQEAISALQMALESDRKMQLENLIGSKDTSPEQEKALENESKVISSSAIEEGVFRMDKACQQQLDRNFDKFELYTIRNILTVPRHLLEGGYIHLKHHDYLDVVEQAQTSSKEHDKRLQTLVKNINLELHLLKILKLQVAKAKEIVLSLTQYKRCMDDLVLMHGNKDLNPNASKALRDTLEPMNESIYYLLTQAGELVTQVLALNDKLLLPPMARAVGDTKLRPLSRDVFNEDKTQILLEKIGILHDKRLDHRSQIGLN